MKVGIVAYIHMLYFSGEIFTEDTPPTPPDPTCPTHAVPLRALRVVPVGRG